MQICTKIKTTDDMKPLWGSFLSGNNGALSLIYKETVNNLFSFGATFTTDTELIKDCIQEIFIRIYQNRARLKSVENIKAYLLVSLKNALINEFGKRQTYQKFIDAYRVEEPDETEEERIITQESEIALRKTVAKYKSALSMRQQEIIHYRFVDELTIEEISELLNISYQSVANMIQRSLKKIRNLYLKRE
jgi:RNA polymerase sigma factor (sigma-70 family)